MGNALVYKVSGFHRNPGILKSLGTYKRNPWFSREDYTRFLKNLVKSCSMSFGKYRDFTGRGPISTSLRQHAERDDFTRNHQ